MELFERCVAAPIQEMRLAVAWAVLYSGLVECVFIVVMWVLCFNCWMGCCHPVARRHLFCVPQALGVSYVGVVIPSRLWSSIRPIVL